MGAGVPNIERIDDAMESEHTMKPGFNKKFTTANYRITTTPHKEWEYVLTKSHIGTESELRHGRKIPDIAQLLKTDETVKRSGLMRGEVIAVVLFTGPMVFYP